MFYSKRLRKMSLVRNGLVALYVSVAMASISFHRSGWLDRVVQYHKSNFFTDFQKLPPVQIKATIERAPYGYVDPRTWDYDSVLRLLGLLQQSEGADSVLRYLRRALISRRSMKYGDTLKAFPSLSKDHPNYFYYNVDSMEYSVDQSGVTDDVSDDNIIAISNPTEARLPAAQISVKLLREILEARAMAARYMPTTRWTISWKPMNKTTSASEQKPTTAGSGTDAGSGNVTSADGGNSTAPARAETVAATGATTAATT